jgi:hypothetical protein
MKNLIKTTKFFRSTVSTPLLKQGGVPVGRGGCKMTGVSEVGWLYQ